MAGGVAIALILLGFVLIMGRNRLPAPVAVAGLTLMAGLYLAGAVLVATLGAPS